MRTLCPCHAPAACPASKPLITWGSGQPCWTGLVPPRSGLGAGGCMTALTSTPGSMSIRVEGGP